jgi:Na+/H+ antiporter NhaA
VGVGLLAGIGFTVSLFITELAYGDPDVADAAKLGVLAGSVIAAAAGTLVLRLSHRRRGSPDSRAGTRRP